MLACLNKAAWPPLPAKDIRNRAPSVSMMPAVNTRVTFPSCAAYGDQKCNRFGQPQSERGCWDQEKQTVEGAAKALWKAEAT
jgi:hypothetical protein